MNIQDHLIEQIGAAIGAKSAIKILKTLGGKSGASVLLIDIQLESWDGTAILKIESLSNVIGRAPEATAHTTAGNASKEFSEAHVPRLISSFETTEFYISVFTTVAGGIENSRSLISLPGRLHKNTCENVTKDLLSKWNCNAAPANSNCSDSNILQSWLGYRLEKSEGGRIPDRLEKYQIDQASKAFSYAGLVFPNPLYWSLNDNLYVNGGLRPVIGQLHNDLHEENILFIPGELGKDQNYYLIDFALAESEKPLFFDQAYLEFSSLLAACESLSIQIWIEEILKLSKVESIQDMHRLEVDKYRVRLADSVVAIRHECKSWIKKNFNDRATQLYRQQLLGRVAAALNFFNKSGLDSQAEFKALLYAAISLRAYFEYCRLQIPNSTCALHEPHLKSGIAANEVRDASQFLNSFEAGRHVYVLISSLEKDELSNFDPELASRVNWSLIADCSTNSEDQSFFSKLNPYIEKTGVVRLKMPNDVIHSSTPSRSTTWIKVRGWSKLPESQAADLDIWRRKKLRKLQEMISEIFDALSPMSIRIVMLQGSQWQEYASTICSAIYEMSGVDDIKTLWLGPRAENSNLQANTLFEISDKPVEHFNAGLEMSLGKRMNPSQIFLPLRNSNERGGVEYKEVTDQRTLNIISEELELVHSNLGSIEAQLVEGDFLKGAPISWPELELEQDLKRDVYEETKDNLQRALADPRNRMFEITHKPGAGGTTFARRLLWDFRYFHPTAVLRNINDNTASRVETLFHLCSLPVLLLAEADVCTKEDISRLLSTTSSRNVRCCVLFVSRLTGSAPNRSITGISTFINDIMIPSETKKFFGRYSVGASSTQIEQLRQLASSNDKQKFRSPFFFGLYRYEESFSHISDYVKGHLQGLDERQKILLSYISLISVFTQSGMPERLLSLLANQKYTPGIMIGRIFGQDVDRLFVSYGQVSEVIVKASHPLLAQQTLEVTLNTNKENKGEHWQNQLSQISKKLIKEFSEFSEFNESEFSDLLMQLFIQREHISADARKRNLFSPLLTEISNEAYQAEILRQLTTVLPDEPHFWNHFGRHCMYSKSKRFNDAISHLAKAIELAPEDELHLHTIGMIYGLRVRETLSQFGRHSNEHVAAWYKIENDYKSAREYFLAARNLSGGSSQYPLISDIQLVTRTISALRGISQAENFYNFLVEETTISELVREELSSANNLLSEVKRLTDERAEHPEYVEDVELHLKRIESSPEQLVSYLRGKIQEPNGNTIRNRRFLLSVCQFQRRRSDSTITNVEELNALLKIAESNLDTESPTDQDFRHWFSIYRESPSFNIMEAIDNVTRWQNSTTSIDSAYYLYILYFTQWYDGEITNVDVVMEALERCVSLSQERNRRQSFEYLALSQSGIGIIAADQLGERDPETSFFSSTDKLAQVEGIIKNVSGPQAGNITIVPLWQSENRFNSHPINVEAFFLPAEKFHAEVDQNISVKFFLGFRRGGLRAYMVERVNANDKN